MNSISHLTLESSISDFKQIISEGKIFEDPNFVEQFSALPSNIRKKFGETLIEEVEKDLIPGCFRSYDIRINSIYLPNHVVFYLGLKALPLLKGFTFTNDAAISIGVGRAATHARPSSQRIHSSYMNGLALRGAKVIDLGVTTTPDVYFSCAYLLNENVKAVVNISASHNPQKDNGIKHCILTPGQFIHSISQEQMNIFKKHTLKGCEEKLETDKELLQDLENLPYKIHLPQSFSPDPDAISRLHHAFILLYSLLGKEALIALNHKFDGDFKKVISTISEESSPKELIPEILKLQDLTWQEVLSHFGLSENLIKPHQFGPSPLKDFVIVLDYGKGTAYRTGEVYRSLGAEVIEIAEERGFNPLETRNQVHLKAALKKYKDQYLGKEIIGLAHDEDGDRLAVMRSDGIAVDGDRLLVIACMDSQEGNSSTKKPMVISEVKSRPETREALETLNTEYLITPTGFAFIKKAAIDIEKAFRAYQEDSKNNSSEITLYGKQLKLDQIKPVEVWSELSGHFGLGQDLCYFFDDASLMALHLLLSLSQKIQEGVPAGQVLTTLDSSFPRFPSSGELNLFVKTENPEYVPSSEEKEKVVQHFSSIFSQHPDVERVDKTDGIQVFFNHEQGGWMLIRKSNNEDKLVVVTSAPNQNRLDHIERIFFEEASKVQQNPITGLVLRKEDEQGEERTTDPYIEKRIKDLL